MSIRAIAVRRGPADLRLFGEIQRESSGDIYVNWITEADDSHAGNIPAKKDARGVPNWRPHASKHASGQKHSKSHGKAHVIRKTQPPDATFKGCEQLETTNADRMLSASLPPCDASKYVEIMEVPIEVIRDHEEPGQLHLAVDIVEPGVGPLGYDGTSEKALKVWTIKDAVPWIHVTLWDVSGVLPRSAPARGPDVAG